MKNTEKVVDMIILKRKEKGLSRIELSKKCGLSPNYFASLENGFVSPGLKTLFTIMRILEIDINDIKDDI